MNKCKCGSTKFLALMTLELSEVPVNMLRDGSVSYDDTKGQSEGWDTLEQPEVTCAKCGHIYALEREEADTKDDRPTYTLKDMQTGGGDHV
jgi:hypothetical protein